MSKRNWQQTEATVYTCGVQNEYQPGVVGGVGFIDSEHLIVFSYEIDGEWYSGEFTSPSVRTEGSTFPLRYDANDPAHNEYSVTAAMDTLPVNILLYAGGAALAILYIWFRDFRHH
jgi:hypothetical protein